MLKRTFGRTNCFPMRILFFGMLGAFSHPPLHALIKAGMSVVGVVVPTDNSAEIIRELRPVTAHPELSTLQLAPNQPNIVHLAWQHHIPVYEVSRLSAPETQQTLADLRPEVACVACFNKRIPANSAGTAPARFFERASFPAAPLSRPRAAVLDVSGRHSGNRRHCAFHGRRAGHRRHRPTSAAHPARWHLWPRSR